MNVDVVDVLSVVDEMKICVAYERQGKRITDFPGDAFVLDECKPIYESMPGWRTDLTGLRKWADLPAAAWRYVDRIAELIGRPVTIVSVGPDREQTILLR